MLNHGNAARFNQIAFLQKFLVYAVYRAFFKTDYRQFRHTVFFFDTNNYISAAPIVNVICKSADGMQNWLGVPVAFILYARAFYYPAIYQVVYIDWQSHFDSSFDYPL